VLDILDGWDKLNASVQREISWDGKMPHSFLPPVDLGQMLYVASESEIYSPVRFCHAFSLSLSLQLHKKAIIKASDDQRGGM
jgi:hypothetical protein